jgi:ABC-type uncharacterized transport system ATPase subunit
METELWEFIKATFHWIVISVLGLFAYLFKKHASDVDTLKEQVAMLKTSQAVAESQIKDIRDDIKDLIKVVKEVEYTIVADIKTLQKELRNKFR